MSRAAFVKAERTRRRQTPPTPGQRRQLERLAAQAGIETPTVRWRSEARDAIRRLKHYLAQPMLDGWRQASA